MNNKILKYVFLVSGIICLLFFLDSVHFIFFKKEATVRVVSKESIGKDKTKIILEFMRYGNLTHVTKIKKTDLIKNFLNMEDKKIFYSIIWKNEIKFNNENYIMFGSNLSLMISSVMFFYGFSHMRKEE